MPALPKEPFGPRSRLMDTTCTPYICILRCLGDHQLQITPRSLHPYSITPVQSMKNHKIVYDKIMQYEGEGRGMRIMDSISSWRADRVPGDTDSDSGKIWPLSCQGPREPLSPQPPEHVLVSGRTYTSRPQNKVVADPSCCLICIRRAKDLPP